MDSESALPVWQRGELSLYNNKQPHQHLFAVEPYMENLITGEKRVFRFCIKCREDLLGKEETIRRALEAGRILQEWSLAKRERSEKP